MKTLTKIFFLFSLILFLSSCASSVESLQRATAKQVGNTRLQDVLIYNVKRSASTVSWLAKTKSGCYECDADDMVRQVNCVKVNCDSLEMTKAED
jgi:hypothetical protein